MLDLVRARKELKEKYVNLLEYEGRVAFRPFYKPLALPEQETIKDDFEVSRTLWGSIRRKKIRALVPGGAQPKIQIVLYVACRQRPMHLMALRQITDALRPLVAAQDGQRLPAKADDAA